jgi:hypothetical protein
LLLTTALLYSGRRRLFLFDEFVSRFIVLVCLQVKAASAGTATSVAVVVAAETKKASHVPPLFGLTHFLPLFSDGPRFAQDGRRCGQQ